MSTPTLYPHVTSDPAVSEGQPCVGDTGIRVTDVAAAHEDGQTPMALQEYFADSPRPLTLPEVFSALAYYYDNKDVLEQVRVDNQRAEDEATKDRHAEILRRFVGR